MHFFNPAPVMKLVEVVRTVVTEPDGGRRRRGAGRAARQGRRHDRRPGRLHRQRAAVRLPQPRRVDVRGPVRHPRGHRRGDEARLRAADGPAGAARPDRPGHRVRDPGHDVPAVARPAARAGADAQADGHRRAARPQDRPRLLHLRGAGLAGGRRRTRPPRPGRRRPSGARPVRDGRRGRLRHDGHRHRRGVREGRLRRRSSSPAAQEKVGRVLAALRQARWTRRCVRGKLDRGRPGRGAGPGHPVDQRWTTWPTSTWWSRRWSRTWRSSRRCSPSLDEICKPGAVLATTTSSLPVVECAAATGRPGRRGRACTSSTRRR